MASSAVRVSCTRAGAITRPAASAKATELAATSAIAREKTRSGAGVCEGDALAMGRHASRGALNNA